jgi:hypothetical protein
VVTWNSVQEKGARRSCVEPKSERCPDGFGGGKSAGRPAFRREDRAGSEGEGGRFGAGSSRTAYEVLNYSRTNLSKASVSECNSWAKLSIRP